MTTPTAFYQAALENHVAPTRRAAEFIAAQWISPTGIFNPYRTKTAREGLDAA